MVATNKTWTSTLNVSLGSDTDQGVQYATFMLAWVAQLIAAGWTVVRSSNGVTVANSNLWAVLADIVWGGAAQARSWIVLQAPVGWGAPSTGLRFHIFIDCRNTAPDTTPQEYFAGLSTLAYTGGTTSAAPTTTGAVQNTLGSARCLDHATPSAARVSFWRTADGDVLWFTKLTSDTAFRSTYWLVDPIFARGANRAMRAHFWGGITFGNIGTSSYCGGFSIDGLATAGLTLSSDVSFTSNWTSGQDAAGQEAFLGVRAVGNNAGLAARYLDILPDIWGFAIGAPWSYSDTGDTDPVRLRGLGSNNFALPVPAGAPALE